MKSDGYLLRMRGADFEPLIRQPMVKMVTPDQAFSAIRAGAGWVDVRPPDQYLARAFEDALNIPLTLLRLECQKLSRKRRYVVCSNDARRAAVGTLLLVQRGLQAVCLDATVAETADHALVEQASFEADGETSTSTDTILPFPGSAAINHSAPEKPTETDMNDSDQGRDQISTPTPQSGAEVESTEPIPRDLYDDTYVGKSLADLIDQMHSRHQELVEESHTPNEPDEDAVSVIDLESFEREVEQTLPQNADDSPVLT